jgi:Protein of unknown function (DUF1189)
MNTTFYNINAIYYSLFSRGFYAELINKNSVLGLRYLFIMAVLVALPLSLTMKSKVSAMVRSNPSESVESNLAYIEKQLPAIFLKNENLKIEAFTNVEILSMSGDLIAVFDIERTVQDLAKYDSILVINPETLRFKLPNGKIEVFMIDEVSGSLGRYFDDTPEGKKFNPERFFEGIKQVYSVPLPIIVLFTAIGYFLVYLVSAIIYSFVVGSFFLLLYEKPLLSFRKCFRVAAFTLTPVVMLEAISNALGGNIFSYTSLVYFTTHIIYIYFALESYKKLSATNGVKNA